ncbi:hypothetical protein Tco_1376029, partial [Tanacetum coccineum]
MHRSAKYYTEEDWDIIRANVESNAELSKILLGENELGETLTKRMAELTISEKSKIMDSAKIYIDNESTICIVKNPVYHSKTKHIAIRHHFIRDAYEKKLIQVLKIHTDDNVADLLTKAFDVSRFQFLVCAEAFLNISDEFQEVNWVFKSHWEEIQTMSAKSKILNNVRHITAKVAGKPVSISEASIRSDLLFNDADGIDSLPNQAIFDAIQLMG